ITPYFLEKGNVWYAQNINKILEARKTQTFFEDNTIILEKNQKANLSEILRKLDEMGYEKVLEVTFPGEFSQRGGVLDVFPINLNQAVRFELFGNKIEEIFELPATFEDERQAKDILKKRLKSQKLFSDLKGIKPGDYLVHLDHGIGQFRGIEKIQIPNPKLQTNLKSQIQNTEDYYVLDYAQGDKLYVPVGLERKLSRYIGFAEPKISRLTSLTWQRTKKRVREEAEKLARELLEIYAKREVATRPPYLPDNEIDLQVASGFKYEETPDQIQTIEDIKSDLAKPEPMDRIVCGDVGFGKTEVALRTLVKAVNSGYQAAMICPTTILANQHFHNFKERLKNLPINVSLLSRLQSKREQENIIERLKGKIDPVRNSPPRRPFGRASASVIFNGVDIVIGTHRVLSNDVEFKNLGLLVIDDEQRFGVKQKEKLKKIRTSLDVLSLSATPIPRTLYLALSSLKNISLMQTPPSGRLPVKTFIKPWSKEIIKEAINNELKRNGQVYYLHNRVETIGTVKNYLEKLLPAASFGIAHGRMKEKDLVKVMNDFSASGEQNKKIDVLIATTIIENGIDLPNVNTLISDDATKLGLSQAYQIRGRIGRSYIQAFAYFLYGKNLSALAAERLTALKEAEELGSGYKIAMKDLEIRGAGNILGKEQSGSINAIGLNLYAQMLSESIEKIKSSTLESRA
ncbi:MAG: CarD family transcriptional regulator, partial [Candidatus Pacebacteria bacterium]|nr:CarD family transcriptional regulator [Candidatus Paceibacterota bacterium]